MVRQPFWNSLSVRDGRKKRQTIEKTLIKAAFHQTPDTLYQARRPKIFLFPVSRPYETGTDCKFLLSFRERATKNKHFSEMS